MNKINKYILLFCLPLMVVTSCNKLEDFGDTNKNPGAAVDPIPSALLTNITVGLMGYASHTRGGLYCQYFSETQYTDVSLYSVPQVEFHTEYAGGLYDAQNLINMTGYGVTKNQKAAARIALAYAYWTITDRWGDVPYSQALKGNPNPAYDSQESIYKSLIAELAKADTAFDNSLLTGDVLTNGNVAAWKRFANSLRMLMALRLSKRFPAAGAYAAEEFNKAMNAAGGHITTNAHNIVADYPGEGFKLSWYNLYDGRKDFAESKTMTDILGSLGDNRQSVFGGASELPSDTNYFKTSNIGVPYGLKRASAEAFTGANPTWARILRGDYRQETDNMTVLGAAQVLLAKAEAADRGWIPAANAKTFYEAGIKASFEEWGLPGPAAGYFTQSGVNFTAPAGTGANLQQIATQRWIATYPNGLQGWCEWRRTGYPVLTPAPDGGGKPIIRRYTYGQVEYGTNNEAVKAAVAKIPGGDTQDGRVWWDQ